jgi:hypothetical protein
MPQINRTYRNLAIILVIGALVDVVPGGGNASSTVLEFVYLAFFGAFVWVASRLYREHRTSLYGLGSRHRAIAYAAVGVIALTLTGTDRLWHDSGAAGNIAWLVLLGGAGYTLYRVFHSARQY